MPPHRWTRQTAGTLFTAWAAVGGPSPLAGQSLEQAVMAAVQHECALRSPGPVGFAIAGEVPARMTDMEGCSGTRREEALECRLGVCGMRGPHEAYLEAVNIIREAEHEVAVWINVYTQRPRSPTVDFLSVRYLLERENGGAWEVRERLEVARS